MSTIAETYAPIQLLLNRSGPAKPRVQRAKQKSEAVSDTPEHRLWKLTAQATQPRLAKIEVLVFVFFLVLGSATAFVGFNELSRLIKNNSVEHVAEKALQSGL
ncbi:MAG: hypothetical protein JOZ08_17305 [Verrucomicrobia bacterium]|nr:hypothetical protein [Verrucomicrobiota bacterium]